MNGQNAEHESGKKRDLAPAQIVRKLRRCPLDLIADNGQPYETILRLLELSQAECWVCPMYIGSQ